MLGNLLKAIRELQEAFAKSDVVAMRVLSNKLMDKAALENSKMIAEVALIGYSLHKLSTKAHIVKHDKWLKVRGRVLASLEKAAKALEEKQEKEFEKIVNGIAAEIKGIDAELGNFVQGLYEKARVKYAASAYSIGLSLSQAAELTGAKKEDVLGYVGATRISDREKSALGIGDRLKKLRKMM